jgi:large subunit ribosomal protein L29
MYREMAISDLNARLQELKRQLFDLRCQAVTEKLANVKAIRNTRREIARVLTVLNEKTRPTL